MKTPCRHTSTLQTPKLAFSSDGVRRVTKEVMRVGLQITPLQSICEFPNVYISCSLSGRGVLETLDFTLTSNLGAAAPRVSRRPPPSVAAASVCPEGARLPPAHTVVSTLWRCKQMRRPASEVQPEHSVEGSFSDGRW